MSRGPGRVQRVILEMVATPEAMAPYVACRPCYADKSGLIGVPVSELTQRVYGIGGKPTRAQQEAVNRAIRSLESAGLVWINHNYDGVGDPATTRSRHVRAVVVDAKP